MIIRELKNKIKIEEIKNNINLPILLFFIILLNFLPLGIPNFISNTFGNKSPYAARVLPTILCFASTCIVLIYYLFKKIKINKEIKVNIILLSIITIILMIIQIINFSIGEFYIKDLANIVSKTINILLFIILMLNIKVKEEEISTFMKYIIYMGIVACVYNMIFFIREILYTLGIIGGMQNIKVKSFFGNRNQFAFFLFISICSNIFMLLKQNDKFYKTSLILFFANLFFAMSRTAILAVGIFICLYFIFSDKYTLKNKLKISMMVIIIGIVGVGLICLLYPNIRERLYSLLLRPESITTLSGRTGIWNVASEVLDGKIQNILFGIGRFKGVEAIKESGRTFTQFHNGYIEAIISGGILELIYTIYLYVLVFIKLKKGNISKNLKGVYKSAIISFLIYIMLESYGRFSMGYVDTLCLIYFITIPILHSNSINKTDEIEVKKEEA